MTATRLNSLTALALAGTAHSPGTPLVSGAPVDDLNLPGEDAGRDLLLRAGAASIYHAAGRLPAHDVAPLDPAPAERHALCPPEAAALIEGLIVTGKDETLLEACARLERRGDLLPPALLPLALAKARSFATSEMRAALAPVAGERGRWLARHNPDWSWLVERTLPGDRDALPDDAETIWQEGTTRQRIELLGRLRAHDPARARAWLASVWKQEKAETRASMLDTFATGLTPEDEPLLESALNDRGERVRAVAAALLAMLPTSALAQRIRDRAGAALTYDGARLDASPPKATDSNWARDGLDAHEGQAGQRAYWLEEILTRTPPSHWARRFGQPPAALIAATAASKWRASLLTGWTGATVRFQDRAWAAPLWDAWLALPEKEIAQTGDERAAHCERLAPLLPAAARESFALRALDGEDAGVPLINALGYLEKPWSVAVARAYLDALRANAEAKVANPQLSPPVWGTFELAARAMPQAIFTEARERITLPESEDWRVTQFSIQLHLFAELVRLREHLAKVLPL